MDENQETFDYKGVPTDLLKGFGENILETTDPHYDDLVINTYTNTSNLGTLVKSFSARVLDWDDSIVKLECLVNKEERKYQVRLFPLDLFKKTDLLIHGQYIKTFLYVKNKVMTFMFENGKNLVSADDFPNSDILDTIGDSSLFKFKK